VGLDPRLGPLQNNGGPTFTHALLSDSPAINRGLAPGATPTDQRGVPRLGAPDIGAFEFFPVLPSLPSSILPAPPPEGIRLVVVKGRGPQKGKTRIQVFGVRSGRLRRTFGPFAGKVKASLRDLNGDGLVDLLIQITRNGRKRLHAFDAVHLSPLPPPRVR
jgi:hypothetical protein